MVKSTVLSVGSSVLRTALEGARSYSQHGPHGHAHDHEDSHDHEHDHEHEHGHQEGGINFTIIGHKVAAALVVTLIGLFGVCIPYFSPRLRRSKRVLELFSVFAAG